MSFLKEFKNPSKEYRGKPFWAWNGKLEPDELRRQLRIFKQMGMGGAFLHSRVGLATEFLGKEWFDCIQACVDECKEQDLEAWLYDEDRWPSGSAGGLVTKNQKYRMQFLKMEILRPNTFKWKKKHLGVWECQIKGHTISEPFRLKNGQKPSSKSQNKVIAVYPQVSPNHSWYNGYTYLDTLSAEAVDQFIKVAYQPYKKHVGEDFGKWIPGVFTDEPNYFLLIGLSKEDNEHAFVPWTRNLLSFFKKRYGYDLSRHLPELFFDIENQSCSQARYHFYDCVTHLFTQNFAGRIGAWCEKNNLLFTGHVLMEENLQLQTLAVGSTMRFYEHMQAPGIDVLTQYSDDFDTAKQCASVTNQMGRKWLLSELYGCTGWDFTFAGHKAVGDWQTALGVNLRCHHLSWYTLKGEAKRDFPAAIFFQSPWWEHYRVVEDYYSRLHVLLTRGKPVRRLLVIHPIESAWLKFRPAIEKDHHIEPPQDHNADVAKLDHTLKKLRNWLLEAHIDFDYGDEEMLSRLSTVKKEKKGTTLKFGKAGYDAVLVPPQITIRSSTLDLLNKFQQAGGTVFFTGSPPKAVNGTPSREPVQIAAKCTRLPLQQNKISDSVFQKIGMVSIQDESGKEVKPVLYMLRKDKNRYSLFICNTNRKKGYCALSIKVRSTGHVVEWNAVSGQQWLLSSTQKGDWIQFETGLPATGSRVFTIEFAKPKTQLKNKPQWVEQQRISLKKPMNYQLSEHNVIVLDRPEYKIENQAWKGPLEILKVDDRVRSHLGIPVREGFMVQPWAQKKSNKEPHCHLNLRYTFAVKDLPKTPFHLVMETPERFKIFLNGAPVSSDIEQGWWVDPSLRRISIEPTRIKPGENEILLELDYQPDDYLEALFLTGNFGVSLSGKNVTLTKQPKSLKLGNWVSQGFPFYGGAVTYRFKAKPPVQKNKRVKISAPGFRGTLIQVFVDHQPAGYLAWPPYELDITDFLQNEEIEIALEVFGSRRNCFGPLHLKNPNPRWTGPGEFRTTGSDWVEEYHLKPCGLYKPPVLIFQKEVNQ